MTARYINLHFTYFTYLHQMQIDDTWFGYVPGKGTTNAIFVVRQLYEKYRAKVKEVYFGFVDVEKTFEVIDTLCCVKLGS